MPFATAVRHPFFSLRNFGDIPVGLQAREGKGRGEEGSPTAALYWPFLQWSSVTQLTDTAWWLPQCGLHKPFPVIIALFFLQNTCKIMHFSSSEGTVENACGSFHSSQITSV